MNFWVIGALVALFSTVFYHEADDILEEIQDFIDGDDDQENKNVLENNGNEKQEIQVKSNCKLDGQNMGADGAQRCGYTVQQLLKPQNKQKPLGLKGKYKTMYNQPKPKKQQPLKPAVSAPKIQNPQKPSEQ